MPDHNWACFKHSCSYFNIFLHNTQCHTWFLVFVNVCLWLGSAILIWARTSRLHKYWDFCCTTIGPRKLLPLPWNKAITLRLRPALEIAKVWGNRSASPRWRLGSSITTDPQPAAPFPPVHGPTLPLNCPPFPPYPDACCSGKAHATHHLHHPNWVVEWHREVSTSLCTDLIGDFTAFLKLKC